MGDEGVQSFIAKSSTSNIVELELRYKSLIKDGTS